MVMPFEDDIETGSRSARPHTHNGLLLDRYGFPDLTADLSDDKILGPGLMSGTSEVDQTRYLLITPTMLREIKRGNMVSWSGPHRLRCHQLESIDEAVGAMEHEPHAGDATAQAALDDTELHGWSKIRNTLRAPLAEFLATFLLVYFGTASNAQALLTDGAGGSWLSLCFGWGVGVLLGVLVAGGVSGGHINPAVTIALATFRGFSWRKVPGYCLAQLLGAFAAGCVVQANYFELVNKYEGGYGVRTFGLPTSSAGVFFTGAQDWMSNVGAFWDEVIGTAMLLIGILALGDANNNPASRGKNAMFLLWIVCGIAAANGIQTSFCINPARDLGPRIAGSIYGYPSTIWSDRNGYPIWCCVIGPITGALLGSFVYDALIFTGKESPLNGSVVS